MELQINKIYYCNWYYSKAIEHAIVKILSPCKNTSFNYNVNSLQYSNNNFIENLREFPKSNFVREASFEEIKWFNACEKANRFIPQDQIPNNELLIQNLIIW